jgi:hypothetical protein
LAECDPREIAISPDQPARQCGAEAVERKIELGRQQRKVIEPHANAAVAEIPNAARMNAPQSRNREQGVSMRPPPFGSASLSAGTHWHASFWLVAAYTQYPPSPGCRQTIMRGMGAAMIVAD